MKRIIIFIFFIITTMSISLYADNNNDLLLKDVPFKDQNLRKSLSDYWSKPVVEINNLFLREKEIKDLSGIEYLQNLKSLEIDFNCVEDLSPLKKLSRLKSLDLNYT